MAVGYIDVPVLILGIDDILRGPWDWLHSVPAPAILECGGQRSATPVWLARPGVPAQSKRRRRCAVPAHSKSPACRLSCGLLFRTPAAGFLIPNCTTTPKCNTALFSQPAQIS